MLVKLQVSESGDGGFEHVGDGETSDRQFFERKFAHNLRKLLLC